MRDYRGVLAHVSLATAAVMLLSLLVVQPADAAVRRYVSGWIPYWGTADSVANLKANADLFTDVSPFWHALTSDTTVSDQESSADRALVLNTARAAGVPVVAAVTDGTGRGQLAQALADPIRRATVVNTLVGLVTSRGYDGLDLDLEGFAYSDPKSSWATTRPNWVRFVAALGEQLHARGKVLHATIPPTYNSNRDSSSGYWVYDYAGMAPHVDRVRIMAYDYSVGSPGPIAPYDWVQRIVRYAVTQVPPEKLVLGIPAYGRDWVTSVSGTCPEGTDPKRRSLSAEAAWRVAEEKGATVRWDSSVRERTFTYSDTFADQAKSCTVGRKVYFSDASAIAQRTRLAYDWQFAAIALWNVGGTDGRTWPALRSLATEFGGPGGWDVVRLAGADRYATAVAVSRDGYAPGVATAYVASGQNFPDALAAGPAGGPVLLVQPTAVPAAVATELRRLAPGRIVIAGGTGAVSAAVERQLAGIAPVVRAAGPNRYATAAAVSALSHPGGSPVAYLATGANYPDALAAGPAAARRGAPLLLTAGDRLTGEAAAELARLGVREVIIAGGTGAVSAAVESQLRQLGYTVTRAAGPDRYATATALSKQVFGAGSAGQVYLATGRNFPDALGAGAAAAGRGVPLVLSDRTCMPTTSRDEIRRVGAGTARVSGGTAVLSDSAARGVVC